MANKITLKSSSYDGRYMQLVCEQTSNGSAENTSTIKWTLSTVGSSDTYYSTGPTEVVINGTTVYSKSRVDWSSESFPATAGSKSGKLTVSHKTDGTKSIKVSFSTAIYTSTVSTYSDTWELDPIPRYGTCTHSFNSKTETSIKMNWSSDNTVDYLWYSKDDGANWTGVNVTDGKSGTYTISGLTADTTYKIKTRIRRKDSQLTTDSSRLYVTTYDYPYCTETPNFTLGNSVTLKFYNPLKRAFKFYIIGNGTQIDVEYECSSTSYTGVTSTTTSVPYLYATIQNAKSGKYKVKVVYSSSTRTRDNGNTYSIKESACYPTFTSFTYKDTNATITAITGNNQVLVKGLSTLSVEIPSTSKMTPKNSATAKNYIASIDTLSKTINYSATANVSGSLGVLSSHGTKRLNVRAYDSRGLSTLAYKDIVVCDYDAPTISASVKRLNNFEAQSTLKVSGAYSLLTVDGVNKNTVQSVQYRYRETGGTWSSWLNLTTTLSSGKFTCSNVILSLDNTQSFEFEITATDKLKTTKATAVVGVGQAVFFVSSNNKTAYLNGEEVTTTENARQTKRYIQLAENTDLNSIVEIGTYRSIQASHTATMTNLPYTFDGGFTLYVVNWTATAVNTEHRRQEIVFGRMTYVRRTIDGGKTWTDWNTVALVEDLYPVGAVYCSSTNTNPSSKLGGMWTLTDKALKTQTIVSNAIFSPASNMSVYDARCTVSDHNVHIRLRLTVNKALGDTGADLGSFVWSKMGLKAVPMGMFGGSSFTDGANGGIMWNVTWDTGELSQVDTIGVSSIASGTLFTFDMHFVLVQTNMLDEACDRFYWTRTA